MKMSSLLGNRRLLTDLIRSFEAEGIDNHSLDYFAASKNQTVTKFVSGLGIPCIQLEINSNYMPVPSDTNSDRPQRVGQALQALTRYILAHAQKTP